MSSYITCGRLQIDEQFKKFIEDEATPDSGVDPVVFWKGLDALVHEHSAQNRALVAKRAHLQSQIDTWLRERRGAQIDPAEHKAFLERIGYLAPLGDDFEIGSSGLDAEIAHTPGPQLVVPLSNPRYALNAANARWGGLYDALYGSDALGAPLSAQEKAAGLNQERAAKVVAWAKAFLDDTAPLAQGSHAQAQGYRVRAGALLANLGETESPLKDPTKFAGFQGAADAPSGVLLRNNELHIHLKLDRTHAIGASDPAGLADLELEAAVSTIMDCEDSVSAIDAADKVAVYRTWLGLMRGDLEATFDKEGQSVTRRLNPDRYYTTPDQREARLQGRSLMLARSVGHFTTTPAVLDVEGANIFEGMLDLMTLAVIGRRDLMKLPDNPLRNSRKGSIYIVKPKMHGPEEVAFADMMFAQVEDTLDLPSNTLKMGVMDEERRTTLNLKECIRAAKDRLCFINTGFLDRTGDEIHTAMEAGPMMRKGAMKAAPWIGAYENWNVDAGLACGLPGKAQIGKGMWAAPDLMADMLEQKIAHPQAGANCAWVPSPTAATLHATHYHKVDVKSAQQSLAETLKASGPRAQIETLLDLPLGAPSNWNDEDIQTEINNNAQSILGYVVRWVDQGVGCSKVPDIDNVGLMEDRATCRISSQLLANWLHHGVIDPGRMMETMKRMAGVVDQQNAEDPSYKPMTADLSNSIAFQAACDLVLQGRRLPSGYTEPVLHARRASVKAQN